jgi:hypothetical protein
LGLLRCLAFIFASFAAVASAAPRDGVALRAKHASLSLALQQSPFQRPLLLYSVQAPERLQGEAYALVAYPFALVQAGLNSPQHWCEMMLLHFNTKYCYPVLDSRGAVLRVNLGKKTAQDLRDTSRVEFSYQVAQVEPDYLELSLAAAQGALGTSDYRIELQAVPLGSGQTFLHLSYSYAISAAASFAASVYLGTLGSGKVGFTMLDGSAGVPGALVGGVRGAVERNTMRYFLAIDSFLDASRIAGGNQFERSLQNWFTATERYPRQLHEMDRLPYLEMKRLEYQRQQTLR